MSIARLWYKVMGGGFGDVNEAMLNMGGTSERHLSSLSARISMVSLVANSGDARAFEISAATKPIRLVCRWISSSRFNSAEDMGDAS